MSAIFSIRGLAGKWLLSVALLAVLAGCGGGGSGDPAVSRSIAGTAYAGPFQFGNACAYRLQGGTKGALLACGFIVHNSSRFRIDIGSYSGDVLLEVANGSYDDEADPNDTYTSIPDGGIRSLVRVTDAGTTTAALTPFTEVAIRMAGHLDVDAAALAANNLRSELGLPPGLDIFASQPGGPAPADTAYREALRALSLLQYADPALRYNLAVFLTTFAQQHAALASEFRTHLATGLAMGCRVTAGQLSCRQPQVSDQLCRNAPCARLVIPPGGIADGRPSTAPVLVQHPTVDPRSAAGPALAAAMAIGRAKFGLPENPVSVRLESAWRPAELAQATAEKRWYVRGQQNAVLTATLAIGADLAFNTADDVVQEYRNGFGVFGDSGADGVWFTQDDVAIGEWFAGFANLEGDDGAGHRIHIDELAPGTDRVFFTADDSVQGWWSLQTRNAAGDLTQEATFAGPGPDARWFTADDEINGYVDYAYDGAGNLIQRVRYDGPGTDGQWFSGSDAVSEAVAFVHPSPTRTYSFTMASGTDGQWFTQDDAVQRWRMDATNASGRKQVGVDHNSPGADAHWFTADDTVSAQLRLDDGHGSANLEVPVSSAGTDGVWFTGDDVLIDNGYSTSVFEGGDPARPTFTVGLSDAGPDALWFTADDTMSGANAKGYDAAGNMVFFTQFSGVHADGIPFTVDDVTGYWALPCRDFTHFSDLGPDQIAFTADDPGSYVLDVPDPVSGVWVGEYRKGPGADGVWLNADDLIVGTESFTTDGTLETFTRRDADGTIRYYQRTTVSKDATGTTNNRLDYSAPGPDGQWGTGDDVISGRRYMKFDLDHRQTINVGAWSPGPDNTWMTEDDFDSVTRTSYDGAVSYSRNYTGRGPDGVWFTDDDVLSYVSLNVVL